MAWILLACASWHQRPAGSLQMDEIELVWLAGYGRAVDEWLKVGHGTLYGWFSCADGRFYHRIVMARVLEVSAPEIPGTQYRCCCMTARATTDGGTR